MSSPRHAAGFSLIEVLIAIVVLAFGLLALAHLVGRSSQEQLEAIQRTQSMALVQDMVDRINDNRKQAAAYVGDYVPTSPREECAAAPTQVAIDQCEWRNRLAGADAWDGERPIGAPMAARACITTPAPNVYVVAVAWQGVLATGAAESPCAAGVLPVEAGRRVYSAVVQIAQLGA